MSSLLAVRPDNVLSDLAADMSPAKWASISRPLQHRVYLAVVALLLEERVHI